MPQSPEIVRTDLRRALLSSLDDAAVADARSFASLVRAVGAVFAEHTGTGTVRDVSDGVVEAVVRAEAELEPELAEQRERAAADLDNVWVTPQDDTGRAVVGANLDVLAARRWALDFEELVRATVAQDSAAGIKRSRSEVRAAVFAGLPSQIIALLKAVAAGRTDELLALTRLDPAAAATLGRLADELPTSAAIDVTEAAPVDEQRHDWFDLAAQLMTLKVRDPRTVNVFVPMSTLLDVDQRGAWVEGVGPMSPFRVRLLSGETPMRRVVVDEHGQPQLWDTTLTPVFDLADVAQAQAAARHVREQVLAMRSPVVVTDLATQGHDAPAAVQTLVKLRDAACTGVGCGTTSTSAHIELDHETPYDDRAPYAGPTAVWNLACRTDRCHQAKHHGWLVTRDERTGTSTWTSPTGRTYLRPGTWSPLPPLPADLPTPTLPSPLVPLSGTTAGGARAWPTACPCRRTTCAPTTALAGAPHRAPRRAGLRRRGRRPRASRRSEPREPPAGQPRPTPSRWCVSLSDRTIAGPSGNHATSDRHARSRCIR